MVSYCVFLQARINSKRLSKKVLKKICGKSILELIIERLSQIDDIDNIILVTGTKEHNKSLIVEAKRLNLDYFCGSEENILDRFFKASQKYNPDNIIRITADNPIIDLNLLANGIKIFNEANYDILTIDNQSFPKGLNFEIFSKNILQEIWENTKTKLNDNEIFNLTFISPCNQMLSNNYFKKYFLKNTDNHMNLRLTMDYEEDFIFLKKLYENLYPNNKNFGLSDIITLLKDNPSLLKINEKFINSN
jgi:spore coat polysaccharide biosynthesis protein SpsF